MQTINRTRQLYRKITERVTEAKMLEAIQVGNDLKSLKEHKGWKKIESFIDRQEKGGDELLIQEIGTINLLSIPKIFNTFLKYLYVVMERRAYRKIQSYIRISIATGEKYAKRREKAEEAKKK